jgi:TolB protein
MDEQRDIWIVSADGGGPRKVTDHPANDIHPAFSPDGSELAFVSDRDGVDHIWVAPLEEGHRIGEPRQLSRGEASHLFPVWSPDGDRIACRVETANSVEAAVIDARSGSETTWITDGATVHRVQWTASGDELLVSGAWGTPRVTIRYVSIADGRSRAFEPGIDLGLSEFETGNFSCDSSGRIVAYEVHERTGDIWLAEVDLQRRWGVPWS